MFLEYNKIQDEKFIFYSPIAEVIGRYLGLPSNNCGSNGGLRKTEVWNLKTTRSEFYE